MKKIMFFLVVLLVEGWPIHAQEIIPMLPAGGGGGDVTHFLSIRTGAPYDALGNNTSYGPTKPIVGLTYGGIYNKIVGEIDGAIFVPLSPAQNDSSRVQKDSSYYHRGFLRKASAVTIGGGYHTGDEGWNAGVRMRGGISFVQKGPKDRLYALPIWALYIGGGYRMGNLGISAHMGFFYLMSHDRLEFDGYASDLGVAITIFIPD